MRINRTKSNDVKKKDNTMQKRFLAILIILMIAVLFALNNSNPIHLDFWFWQAESNLAIVIFVAFVLGALISFALSIANRLKYKKEVEKKETKLVEKEKEILQLKKELGSMKERLYSIKRSELKRKRESLETHE